MKSYKEEAIGGLVLLVLALVIGAIVGQVGYGDWTCGFTTCVKVK